MSDTTELVDLAVIFPDLEIELKYACADNITGKAIYQQARCLLHKDAITALAKSISIAQLSGLQLVIYDAYRPQQAQAMLWQACPDPQYVVDVAVGSNHSRGKDDREQCRTKRYRSLHDSFLINWRAVCQGI